MKKSTFARLLIISLFLVSCAPSIKDSVSTDYARSHAPSYPLTEYIIQPSDQLDVKFFYNSELNEQVIVRPDGRITLQLIPELTAAGLTPAQLTDLLNKSYAKELADPGITVIVRSFSAQKVYVAGEVNNPGMVNLTGPLTALQSIAEAGGFKDSGRKEQVIIVRKTADNKSLTIVANLEAALIGADRSQDIQLFPYDIVFVPKSAIANVNQFIDLYIRRNVPVPFGLSYEIGAF